MHFYFLSIFVSLKKPLCGGRCSAEPKIFKMKYSYQYGQFVQFKENEFSI